MKVRYVSTLTLLGFRYYVLHKNSFTPNVGEPVPMKHQYQKPRKKNNVNGHLYKKFKSRKFKSKEFYIIF
jgi:hypothetical protein